MTEVVRRRVHHAGVPEFLQRRSGRQFANVQAADANVVVVQDVARDRLDGRVGRGQEEHASRKKRRKINVPGGPE